MKKFFVTIGLILGLTTGVFASSYKNVTISPEARSIISSLRLSSDFVKISTFDGVGYYALKYNDVSVEFYYLSNTKITEISYKDLYNYKKSGNHEGKMKRGTYIQVETKVSPYNKDKADCESFIKAVAPNHSKVHRKGALVLPNYKIKSGTVIYSHSNSKHNGHIAILLKITKNYIWVMDQNAYIYKKKYGSHNGGIVGIHKIKFKERCSKTDTECYYDNSNAYNYSVIRFKE